MFALTEGLSRQCVGLSALKAMQIQLWILNWIHSVAEVQLLVEATPPYGPRPDQLPQTEPEHEAPQGKPVPPQHKEQLGQSATSQAPQQLSSGGKWAKVNATTT